MTLPPFAPLSLLTTLDAGYDAVVRDDADAAEGDGFSLQAVDVFESVVRVQLCGELDVASGPVLVAGLALLGDGSPGLVGWGDPGTVQLEMSALTFLDCAGLSALNQARDDLVAAGWRVCLTEPRGAVLLLLDIAVAAGWIDADLPAPPSSRPRTPPATTSSD